MDRRQFLKSAAMQIGSLGAVLMGCDNPLSVNSSRDPWTCTFGVIADAQYCYNPDYKGNRFYRDTLYKMNDCVHQLNSLNLDFVVHLGDFIDRYNSKSEGDQNLTCFQEINEGINLGSGEFGQKLCGFSFIQTQKYHVLGNHDYWAYRDTYSIEQLYHDYGLHHFAYKKGYYAFSPHEKSAFRFIVLDSYENGNYIGLEQRRWLEDELASAEAENQRVIIFSHIGVYPEHPHNWIKNQEEVFTIFDKFSCIVAYMNGHNHSGNYGKRKGVHYINFKGMVETPYSKGSDNSNALSIVSLSEDRAVINGFGRDSYDCGNCFSDGIYEFRKVRERSLYI